MVSSKERRKVDMTQAIPVVRHPERGLPVALWQQTHRSNQQHPSHMASTEKTADK